MLIKMNIAVVLLVAATCVSTVYSDVFTSMNRIKDMVLNEKNILDRIQENLVDSKVKKTFSDFYQQRIQNLKGRNLTLEIERLDHPNGAYEVIQEYARDYEGIRKDVLDENVEKATKYMAEIADNDDVMGARLSLLRLQEVYDFNVMDMVKGDYLTFSGPALNSTDAYYVGLTAFTNGNFNLSAQWLSAAAQLLTKEKKLGQHQEDNGYILGLLGRSLVRIGQQNRAAEVYEEAINQGATHPDVPELGKELENIPVQYKDHKTQDLNNFYRLCAIQNKPTGKFTDKRLRCRYRGVYVPYFRFAEEIISNIPYVSLFYDVITNSEAKEVKDISVEKLYRGVVVSQTGQEASVIRTSHVAFIHDHESQSVKSIAARISQLTDLETALAPNGFFSKATSGSEPLQVVNYGLGGHYSVHMDPYDHINDATKNTLKYSGNRLATFLIYLTDVGAGGSTAFPRADLVVSPVKANAVFWYSYTPAGDLDRLTLHAGCPVVVGEKWIINKWILTHANTFTRRCGLTKEATQLDIEADMMRKYKPLSRRKRSSSRA